MGMGFEFNIFTSETKMLRVRYYLIKRNMYCLLNEWKKK